jgi:hypothetical protein
MSLYRFSYVSRFGPTRDEARLDIRSILEVSRRNNARDGLTGALLVGADYFIQVLEGERKPLCAALQRIINDPRHQGVQLEEFTGTPRRYFADWTMRFLEIDRVAPFVASPFVTGGTFNPLRLSADRLLAFLYAAAEGYVDTLDIAARLEVA